MSPSLNTKTIIHYNYHTFLRVAPGMTANSPMKALLSIFQDIEETEAVKEADLASDVIVCKPNGQSFSILLEAMVKFDDFRVLDQVFEYMQSSNITPTPRSLRR